MPKVMVGGGRVQTFRSFAKSLRSSHTDELPLLLVDSEGTVADGHSAWQHLKARPEDNWDQPPDTEDNSAYLMVQSMETWFLADREALRRFFASTFRANAIREWPDLEAVPKNTVLNGLEQATGHRYKKGKISYDLLGQISPHSVSAACPHARKLLDYLRGL